MSIRRILLAALVLLQLLYLGYQYHARTVEMEQSPRLLVACDLYDPRDFFRGDYLQLLYEKTIFLGDARIGKSLWWGESLVKAGREKGEARWAEKRDRGMELERPPADFLPLAPRPVECSDAVELVEESHFKFGMRKGGGLNLVGFWKETPSKLWELARVEVSGSSQDKPSPGELRTPLEDRILRFCFYQTKEGELVVGVKLTCSFPCSLRYYVPENRGNLRKLWQEAFPDEAFPSEKLRFAAEIVVRPKASLMMKRVLLNGIPYEEAVELIRQGKKEELLKGRDAGE